MNHLLTSHILGMSKIKKFLETFKVQKGSLNPTISREMKGSIEQTVGHYQIIDRGTSALITNSHRHPEDEKLRQNIFK